MSQRHREDCRCPNCDAESAAILKMTPSQHAAWCARENSRLAEAMNGGGLRGASARPKKEFRTVRSPVTPSCECGTRNAETLSPADPAPAEPTAEERQRAEEEQRQVDAWISTITTALPFFTRDELLGFHKDTLRQWAEAVASGAVRTAAAIKPTERARLAETGRRRRADAAKKRAADRERRAKELVKRSPLRSAIARLAGDETARVDTAGHEGPRGYSVALDAGRSAADVMHDEARAVRFGDGMPRGYTRGLAARAAADATNEPPSARRPPVVDTPRGYSAALGRRVA